MYMQDIYLHTHHAIRKTDHGTDRSVLALRFVKQSIHYVFQNRNVHYR